MAEKGIGTGRPVKMFVYLPVYLENNKTKPVHIVTKKMPFSRVEIGDIFITPKRDDIYDLVTRRGELKVEQVKRSLKDNSCIVVLERITFTKKEEVQEFVKNIK